ncbi:MAG: hypothetical protein Q4E06_06050 [Lautropia sp.]|nr:hypothetical protein [Lautropia sp.]
MLIKTTKPTSILSATALAVLLAACGSGSDGGSGGAPASNLAPKDAGTTTTTPAGGAGTAESSASADPAAGASSAATTSPITEAGISTELFEKIFSTQTAYVRFGPRAFPIISNFAATEFGYEQPLFEPDPTKQLMQPGASWPEEGEGHGIQMLGYQQPVAGTFYFNVWAQGQPGQAKPDDSMRQSYAEMAYELHNGDGARDRRLTLGTTATLNTGPFTTDAQGKDSYAETNRLAAAAPKVIPRDGVLNYNEAIQEWKGTDGHRGYIKLHIRRGDAPNEAALCLVMASSLPDNPGSTERPLTQREACSVWRVPAKWTAETEPVYMGIYVEEDYSTSDHAVTYNNRWWKTKPHQYELELLQGSAGGAASQADSAAGAAGAAAVSAQPTAADTAAAQQEAGKPQRPQPDTAPAQGDTAKPVTPAEAQKPAPSTEAEAQAQEGGAAAPAGDAAKPGAPAADAAQPGATAPAADAAATTPAAPATDAPAAGEAQPGASAPAAGAGATTAPAADAAKPAADAARPGADVSKPGAAPAGDAATAPATDAAAQPGATAPAAGAAKPAADAAQPGAADTAKPAAELPAAHTAPAEDSPVDASNVGNK